MALGYRSCRLAYKGPSSKSARFYYCPNIRKIKFFLNFQRHRMETRFASRHRRRVSNLHPRNFLSFRIALSSSKAGHSSSQKSKKKNKRQKQSGRPTGFPGHFDPTQQNRKNPFGLHGAQRFRYKHPHFLFGKSDPETKKWRKSTSYTNRFDYSR